MTDPITPIVVRVIEAPTPQTGVVDVLLGAVSLAGVLGVLGLLAGIGAGALFIWFRNLRPENSFNGQASNQYRLGLESPRR